MQNWQLGLVLAPFFMLILSVVVLYPARSVVQRYVTGWPRKILLSQNKWAFWIIIGLFYICLFWAASIFEK